jgi:hypothetical protein
MNFNFNIKDMLEAAGQSIRRATNARDLHHTGKYGIKWMFAARKLSAGDMHANRRVKNYSRLLGHHSSGFGAIKSGANRRLTQLSGRDRPAENADIAHP